MSKIESQPRLFMDNEVLDEVYANRETLSARFHYDVHELGNYLRERHEELKKQGICFVNKEDLEERKRH